MKDYDKALLEKINKLEKLYINKINSAIQDLYSINSSILLIVENANNSELIDAEFKKINSTLRKTQLKYNTLKKKYNKFLCEKNMVITEMQKKYTIKEIKDASS